MSWSDLPGDIAEEFRYLDVPELVGLEGRVGDFAATDLASCIRCSEPAVGPRAKYCAVCLATVRSQKALDRHRKAPHYVIRRKR